MDPVLNSWYYGNNSGNSPLSKSLDATPVSPEDVVKQKIQDEIIKQEAEKLNLGAGLTTKTDNVIVGDKLKILKALGLIDVIRSKLKMADYLSGATLDNPVVKEETVQDIKRLVNDLSEIVGGL